MSLKAIAGRSLYTLLGSIIVLVVVGVLGAHATYTYLSQRDEMIEEMAQSSALSIGSLQKNIAALMEAYAVHEYDNLVATEINLRQHFAIVVSDANMGKVLGQEAYVSGKVRDASGSVIDFNSKDPEHQRWLADSFYRDAAPIVASSGNILGNVSIYISDEKMRQQLRLSLVENLLHTLAIAALLIALMLWVIHRTLVRPLSQIARVIGQVDGDGVPTAAIPTYSCREIDILTDTMRQMVRVIRQSRNSLQRESKRLQSVLEGTNVGTWEWNVQTGETIFNERWAEIIGYTLSELQPVSIDTWLRLAHPEDLEISGKCLEAHFSGQTDYYDCEVRTLHKDGRWVWVHDRGKVSAWTEDGKPLLMAGTHQDITARKEAEIELERYQRHLEALVEERTNALSIAKEAAETASRAKSAFLANMSHELRTPMNGVMGMINLARQRMADEKGIDHLDKAKKAAQHLLAVLNDILDISKIEAERMVLEALPFQIGVVLENVFSMAGQRALDKGLQLSVDRPDELARQPVMGDPLRLGQVLLNLVGNAIKFTQQGSVVVRTSLVEDALDHVVVRFEIEDTGIGIDPEAQERLFSAFEQVDNSMTRRYGGTGLGLAISKRLVWMMGGEIGVKSTPGLGSTFWFTVILLKRDANATPEAAADLRESAEGLLRHGHHGARILLAEDEPINQEVAKELLEDADLVVDLAEDGQQALELARKNRYALILMDMQMPNLNGVEATRFIRAQSRNVDTPILAMTANAFSEDRQICLDAGMNDHIAKPVNPDVLFATMLRLMEASAEQASDTQSCSVAG